ncbi:MAG: beta-ketoacyl synthase chain length factor [Verrucomicrobiales bacterium]|jgi:4-coumarate--CoA ligase (photoactive yellow protein activation family)|nr:beta-ketoacyl synthase chain length factor [Verrucomicrobiales bacterium]
MNRSNDLFVEASALARDAREAEQLFPARALRRLDNYTKLSLAAAALTLRRAGLDWAGERRLGLIVASALGPVRRACAFLDSILDDGELCASPLAFSASVHNVAATYLTMLLNLRGPALTVSQKGGSFASALVTARSWLSAGRCDHILLGVVDERCPFAGQLPAPALADQHLVADDGAVFFLLGHTGGATLTTGDIGNDWAAARRLATTLTPLFTDDDVRNIAADFIKTELARRKRNVLAVFENRPPEETLAAADADTREQILRDLLAIFRAGSDHLPAGAGALSAVLARCRAAVTASDGAFNFRTSGSTGEPVDCLHSGANLREEMAGTAALFPRVRRIVSVVPAHHAYGFNFALQLPKWLGVSAVARPPLPSLPWPDLLADGDLLVAFPLFLRQLMDTDFSFPPGVTVITATAPCPDELFAKILHRGAARVVENYGSSESGAIATRERPGAPFRLLPFWAPVIVSGRLERIVRKNSALDVPLPDLAEMRGARDFTISGRRDKAVQVAGVNVYPQKVEKFLRAHDLVKDVAIRPAADGGRLKAFIVLRHDADRDRAEKILRAHMQALTAHEIPKELTFGPALPVTALGKKADW